MLAALIAIAGCGSDEPSEPEPPQVDASAYAELIGWSLPAAPEDGEDPEVVFVTSLNDEVLSLETQVSVIDSLAEAFDVRFVDQYEEILDTGDATAPPNDDGTLVGVGTITREAPHTVRVEVYHDANTVEAFLVTLTNVDDEWEVEGAEAVEREVLVGPE